MNTSDSVESSQTEEMGLFCVYRHRRTEAAGPGDRVLTSKHRNEAVTCFGLALELWFGLATSACSGSRSPGRFVVQTEGKGHWPCGGIMGSGTRRAVISLHETTALRHGPQKTGQKKMDTSFEF